VYKLEEGWIDAGGTHDRHTSAQEHAENPDSSGRTSNNIINLINHDELQWQLTHVNTGPEIMP
jgi:hypothetical protein